MRVEIVFNFDVDQDGAVLEEVNEMLEAVFVDPKIDWRDSRTVWIHDVKTMMGVYSVKSITTQEEG